MFTRLRVGRVIAVAMLCVAAMLHGLPPATPIAHAATTWTVTRSDDREDTCANGTDCSLREALAAATNGDTIVFKAGLTQIDLALGHLVVDQSLTIQGPGADVLTVRNATGNHADRIFAVTSGSSTISGLTIADGGNLGSGGGIRVGQGATLGITACAITRNIALVGGGIYSEGTLSIRDSTLSDNFGREAGGAMFLDGPTTIRNSTIVNSPAQGGSIANRSTLTIVSSTIAQNESLNLMNFAQPGQPAIVIIQSSIFVKADVHENFVRRKESGASESLISLGHNLIDDDSSGLLNGANGDLIGTSVMAGVDTMLADNGGPTPTLKLLPNSQAIDAGASEMVTDQRGRPRAGAGAAADIGAFEVQPPGVDLNGTAAGVDFNGTFPAGGGAVAAVNSTGLSVTADRATVASATVTILDQFDGPVETLAASVTGTGLNPPSYNPTTGVLSLTGAGTPAHYQQVLRTVTYNNTSPDPDPRSRHLRFVLNDGVADGPPSTSTLVVSPGNIAPPTISPIADQGVDSSGSTPTVPFTVGSTRVPVTSLVVSATSSNQTLVPNSAITLGGSAATRTVRVTPTPHLAGVSTIDIQVSDGTATAHATFRVTVLESSLVATAVNDSYTLGRLQSLTVPASAGVLANDAGVGSANGGQPATATLVTGTEHGTVNLSPDGGFSYTPTTGFVGTDSFTYVIGSGPARSLPGRVTITVLTVACAPRASVSVASVAVGGKLQVTVMAQPLDPQTNNTLVELRFGTFQNGRVTLDNQPVASGATVAMPTNARTATFTVERATPGQPTTVPFTAVDLCGAWPSFVGGGPGAGF